MGVQVELKVPALTHNIQNTSIHRKWAYRQLFHCVRKEYNSDTSLFLPNLLTIRTQTRFPIKDNRGDCPTEKWATHNTFLLCSNQRSVLLHLCQRLIYYLKNTNMAIIITYQQKIFVCLILINYRTHTLSTHTSLLESCNHPNKPNPSLTLILTLTLTRVLYCTPCLGWVKDTSRC